MDLSYQDQNTAFKYLEFLNSANGQIQKKVLAKAIISRFPKNRQMAILDAGCGPGWLAGEIKKDFSKVYGCDSSELFIEFAKAHYSSVDFTVAALDKALPYQTNFFDFIILNMVAPDLNNLAGSFKNLSVMLKPSGKLLLTIPNPKYTYPAAVWKRGILGFLLGQKPKLKIKKPPKDGKKIDREFGDGVKINSNYYSLLAYHLAAQTAGLSLSYQQEIKSQNDSPEFDLNYQLFRYPLILLLEFGKIG